LTLSGTGIIFQNAPIFIRKLDPSNTDTGIELNSIQQGAGKTTAAWLGHPKLFSRHRLQIKIHSNGLPVGQGWH
jgi:hypothetical protein